MRRHRWAAFHRWFRIAMLAWAVTSTSWLVLSFRTRGVASALLTSDAAVLVERSADTLSFTPRADPAPRGLIFLAGGGVAPEAYAPLLRPLADSGHRVRVLGLPFRLAPLESHKWQAVTRARALLEHDPPPRGWVLAGHSLGAALACRVAAAAPEQLAALVLLGTTHPRSIDLSGSPLPITKVWATRDGVATPASIEAHRALLPPTTRWIEIAGGNHSQFGHYGRQLFDGSATISRSAQQALARQALLEALDVD